jgi:hypothetical protein
MPHSAEPQLKTALAHESGDPGLPFKERTEGRKSRETVPLRRIHRDHKVHIGLKY